MPETPQKPPEKKLLDQVRAVMRPDPSITPSAPKKLTPTGLCASSTFIKNATPKRWTPPKSKPFSTTWPSMSGSPPLPKTRPFSALLFLYKHCAPQPPRHPH